MWLHKVLIISSSIIRNLGAVPCTYVAEKSSDTFTRFAWVFVCSFHDYGKENLQCNWQWLQFFYLTVMCPTFRWYNKDITRTEAEELLLKEVDLKHNTLIQVIQFSIVKRLHFHGKDAVQVPSYRQPIRHSPRAPYFMGASQSINLHFSLVFHLYF